MEKRTLLRYLRDEDKITDEIYDYLQFHLNKHLYFFGDHFNCSLEHMRHERRKMRLMNKLRILNARNYFSQTVKDFDRFKPLIVSNAYFDLNKQLSELGFNVISPPWIATSKNHNLYSASLIRLSLKIRELLDLADFNYLINKKFTSLVAEFKQTYKNFLFSNNVKAIAVPYDEGFFEKVSLRICTELGIPSFLFLHGLPGVYNGVDGNRADYLIVWGKKIRDHFINSGVNKEKIFVSGHSHYRQKNSDDLRFSFDNILVLTKALNWSAHCDNIVLGDRGQMILYQEMIQSVLKKMNINQVRLRPHPSQNFEWYLRFIDRDFYIPDAASLHTSLNNSTLVVGPTSSVFLESISMGVNYVVFEPNINGKDIIGNDIVPPFDESDSHIPVANDVSALYDILKHKRKVDPSFFGEYIQTPFDIKFVTELINQRL